MLTNTERMYFRICAVSSSEVVRFPTMVAQLRLGSSMAPFCSIAVGFVGVKCVPFGFVVLSVGFGVDFVGVGFAAVSFATFVGEEFAIVDVDAVSFVGERFVGVSFVDGSFIGIDFEVGFVGGVCFVGVGFVGVFVNVGFVGVDFVGVVFALGVE